MYSEELIPSSSLWNGLLVRISSTLMKKNFCRNSLLRSIACFVNFTFLIPHPFQFVWICFLQLRRELFMKPCFLNERYLRKGGQYTKVMQHKTFELLNIWNLEIWIYLISFQLDEDDAVKEYQGYKRNHSWKWGMGRLQQLIFTCICIFIWLISLAIAMLRKSDQETHRLQ